ncbi:MAG TPA: methyl-accepting chemotaxis protein [Spirochaetota bacterium]|nr:methyl-accepting chemotaxis protein [Spirochaetota bacterium]HPQ52387.1 methyl-accepting chemotaxis protein [Spirochaetota bacterium]
MKWFNNLKVSMKVFLSCLILLIFLVIVGANGYVSLHSSNEGFTTFYKDRFIPVRQLNRIMRNLLQIRINMLQEEAAAEKGDFAEVESRKQNSMKLAKEYNKLWAEYSATSMTAKEKALADDWVEKAKVPAQIRKKYAEALARRDFTASSQYLAQWLVGFRALRETTDKLINLQQTEGERLMQEEQNAASTSMLLLISVVVIAIGFGILITVVLSRSVSRPVNKGLTFAQLIAKGDFTERIDLDQTDELGMLGKALNESADNLEMLISEIIVATQNLAQAVQEISSGNENLSQRTSEQASSLEEVASTIEEASATIRQNTENATSANTMAKQSVKVGSEGLEIGEETISSINDINQSSNKIADIISVINEIAFQTNLLALNAAVEAARAGDQGRGFAVVAGEVRNLAQRAASSAKEIDGLIKDSVEKVGKGTDLVKRSVESLKDLVESAEKTGELIAEIASASEEQNRGMEQINIAVSELDNMTQQNSALVEETASASEEMSGQAQELLNMMDRFKIRKEIKGAAYSNKHRELHLTSGDKSATVKNSPAAVVAKSGNGNGTNKHPGKPVPDNRRREDGGDVFSQEGFEEF